MFCNSMCCLLPWLTSVGACSCVDCSVGAVWPGGATSVSAARATWVLQYVLDASWADYRGVGSVETSSVDNRLVSAARPTHDHCQACTYHTSDLSTKSSLCKHVILGWVVIETVGHVSGQFQHDAECLLTVGQCEAECLGQCEAEVWGRVCGQCDGVLMSDDLCLIYSSNTWSGQSIEFTSSWFRCLTATVSWSRPSLARLPTLHRSVLSSHTRQYIPRLRTQHVWSNVCSWMTSWKTWHQNYWPHFVSSSRHTCSWSLFLTTCWTSADCLRWT